MRTVIEGQHLWNHPLVQSGQVEKVACARAYSFPDLRGGPAGEQCNPDQMGERLRRELADPNRSGILHLQGWGALTTGLGYEMDEADRAKGVDGFVESVANDELYLHESDLDWACRLSDALGDVRPQHIHLDNEKHLDAGNIYDATKDYDSNAFWNLLRANRRAMRRIDARSPELADLIMDPRPYMSDRPEPNDRWRRFMVLWARYSRRLCAEALSRMLHISGLTMQYGLMKPVRVSGWLYYDSPNAVKDQNGWPAATTTLDGVTSSYAFYGDDVKNTRLLLHAATECIGGPAHFVPVLDLSNDPRVNADRLFALEGIGVQTAILYAPDCNPNSPNDWVCPKNLDALKLLGAI